MIQNGKPVAYASRALPSAETRYAQIEKALLAIVFACDRFDDNLYGRDMVNVETYHKPLSPGDLYEITGIDPPTAPDNVVALAEVKYQKRRRNATGRYLKSRLPANGERHRVLTRFGGHRPLYMAPSDPRLLQTAEECSRRWPSTAEVTRCNQR